MAKSLLYIMILAGLLGGCSSLSSTYVGETKAGAKFEGMPIVLQRPKYIKVTYKKVTYRVFANRTIEKGNDTDAHVEQLGADQTVDEVSTEIVSVGEIYTLDLKRPASGSTEYAAEFEPNTQYPKKVGAKVEDKTIEALGSAIGETLKKVTEAFKVASSDGGGVSTKKIEVVRISEAIVKIELRSLDDPSKVYTVFP